MRSEGGVGLDPPLSSSQVENLVLEFVSVRGYYSLKNTNIFLRLTARAKINPKKSFFVIFRRKASNLGQLKLKLAENALVCDKYSAIFFSECPYLGLIKS